MTSKISVIIPVYNAESYVGRCIESVQAQTYNVWQMILVDDGSKDKSLEICQKYAGIDNRIHVIHQENQGPGIARNTGIAAAKGDYVVFIDSDDYIEKDYFEILAKHDEDEVFINVQNVDEQGNVLQKDFMPSDRTLSKDTILRRQMTGRINWGGVRKALKINVIRDNNVKYTNHKIGEEALYSFQVLWYAKSVAFIDKPLYNYVQREDSQSHLKVDDPWGGVAVAMKNKITEMGLYSQFANTINAFFLTASAVSANSIAKNHSYSTYLTKVKKCRRCLCDVIDKNYPIDKTNMSMKARIVGWLLRYGCYRSIWILGKLKEMRG
ncbi:MAG TPA: hypothetical protein DHU75_04305 [Rikenellaceae bacterium]|nr:hypothetical protein [Rikenellaceae bacterium]